MNSEQKTINNEHFFMCPECGLHYRDEKLAKRCEAFCKKHKACSMEIAKHSLESKSKKASDES